MPVDRMKTYLAVHYFLICFLFAAKSNLLNRVFNFKLALLPKIVYKLLS